MKCMILGTRATCIYVYIYIYIYIYIYDTYSWTPNYVFWDADGCGVIVVQLQKEIETTFRGRRENEIGYFLSLGTLTTTRGTLTTADDKHSLRAKNKKWFVGGLCTLTRSRGNLTTTDDERDVPVNQVPLPGGGVVGHRPSTRREGVASLSLGGLVKHVFSSF